MWMEFNGTGIDVCAIVAIEKGRHDHQAQDYEAIIVHRDGTRIPIKALFQKVITELSTMFPSSAHKCALWSHR